MTKIISQISFNTKIDSLNLLTLPKKASAMLPSRGITSIEGTISGFPFQATLEPNSQGSHWLRINQKMREAIGIHINDIVSVTIMPVKKEPEPKVPADLRKAIEATPKAKTVWLDITPIGRRDWIRWIDTAKLSKTRMRRIKNTCSMLIAGKRRPCCFNYLCPIIN